MEAHFSSGEAGLGKKDHEEEDGGDAGVTRPEDDYKNELWN